MHILHFEAIACAVLIHIHFNMPASISDFNLLIFIKSPQWYLMPTCFSAKNWIRVGEGPQCRHRHLFFFGNGWNRTDCANPTRPTSFKRSFITLTLKVCWWQWTFKQHTRQGSIVGVSIPGGHCVLLLRLFTCVFWIPLTQNLARKRGDNGWWRWMWVSVCVSGFMCL